MLTNAAVKAARPRVAAYKLADQGGLHLYVAPTALKSWRLRFRIDGREQLLTVGSWPEISLDAARARCAQAREQLGRGEDPRQARGEIDAKVLAFEYVSRRWHAHMLPRWTAVHAADVLASLERDVFPAIGAMPIGAITTPVVLNALRSVEERGRLETARRVRQRISAVFTFAIAEGIADHDPAAIVARALTPPAPARHQPALLDVAGARELLAAADRVDASASIKLASRFLALTAVRLAAVRGARWSEIEDLDGSAPVWRVPASRMKLKVAKKADEKNDHVVPLAPAAVELLRAARAIMHSGDANMHWEDANLHDPLIFPGRDGGRPIGEAAIGALYDRAGFAGRHVPHGWRATFSTVMNERGDFDGDLIERALAHAAKDKVKAAYDRSEHQVRLRRLFDAWAAHLSN
ncbi:tyrosine-type recombinase/integrase [Sphingomonas sp. Leaf343]|uniref:tyrosine-type recombinase/integrase n=1 Tax=Sphingomonas sp. Leaf343 TaxID=1736345 RepID=UPI0006F73643|nr:integrase arm-type DNA-binding domain-containing protein [Sphingomonas sp. Leaf343]KQR83458.1 integrase [Sphingomonas sp. Leaf343]